MTLEPLRRDHLTRLRLQPAQRYFSGALSDPDYAVELAEAGPAYALVAGERVLAVGGVAERWHGVGLAWSLLAADIGPHLRTLIRLTDGFFKQGPWHRLEIAVDDGFEEGCRLARLLGFEREGLAKKYTPDGRDCWIFARIAA